MLHTVSLRGLFAIVVWGASFVGTRIALEAVTPNGIVVLRLLAGAGLLGLLLLVRRERLALPRADVPTVAFLGVVLAAHMLLQAVGLLYTTAINTGWIIGFFPVTIALGAHWLGQQRLASGGWAGVALGALGVLLIVVQKPPDFAQARFGDALQLTACLTWTAYTLAGRGAIARSGALRVTAWSLLLAAGLSLALVPWTGICVVWPLPTQVWVALAFLGFVCSGMAYYLWFAASHVYGPTRLAALLYLEPFSTLAVSLWLLGEPVLPTALAGGACVLLGVWLVNRAARSPGA
ncbi:MAG: DMT family transporter [Phycisphaerales bacterium]|nr:DMT family transporter [Phycisphaerales bacterium]